MGKHSQLLFEELKRRADLLLSDPSRDNEATRHDLLVIPFLTSPDGLKWSLDDIRSQASIAVPDEINESHIFRGARPVDRRPDMLIAPIELPVIVAVVEEKKRQDSLEKLDGYRVQLNEYQSLYNCCWGLLTDGERWILKRNFEVHHVFDSINELQKGIRSIQECLSKEAVMSRFTQFGQVDIVHVVTIYRTAPLEAPDELTRSQKDLDIPIEEKKLRPPTREELDKYGDELVVILLMGNNSSGDKIFNYLEIKFKDYFAMRDAIKSGASFDAQKYGKVVEAGIGEPPQEVRERIEGSFKFLSIPEPI